MEQRETAVYNSEMSVVTFEAAARRRARIRLIPLIAVVAAVSVAAGANLLFGSNRNDEFTLTAASTTSGVPNSSTSAATTSSSSTSSTAKPSTTTGSSTATNGATTTSLEPTTSTAAATTSTGAPTTSTPNTTTSAKPTTTSPAPGTTAAAKNSPSPSTTYATTPIPTNSPAQRGFDGNDFPDGAVAGRDIAAGRYWATSCPRWQHFNDETLISKWNPNAMQSMIDIHGGETLVTNCRWNAGNPGPSSVLPTGKVSMLTQLVPGSYRPASNGFCASGPTSTRSPNAISSEKNAIFWDAQTPDLVITGNEGWSAYGIANECGGLARVG